MLVRKVGAGDPVQQKQAARAVLACRAGADQVRLRGAVPELDGTLGDAVASKLEDATGRLRQPRAHTAMLESSVCYRARS